VIAVSGGVDSVVLLDMPVTQKLPTTYQLPPTNYQLIVAHFDHGIREDSAADAEFVSELAKKYGCIFETLREELGANASEDLARARRYKFLRAVAKKHSARLVTAHHADDCIETIAINMIRGTGWRGLAVLDSDIVRPLLDMSKREIIDYASAHCLKWHEDSTNASDAYLRNRIRQKTSSLTDDEKHQLLCLWSRQVALKRQIDDEVDLLVGDDEEYSRYFFTHLDSATATECLRRATQARLTRPQLLRALLAIKTAHVNSFYQAGGGVEFYFTPRNFTIKLIK
jgi:tRNA(Ile)-lysidine synthase